MATTLSIPTIINIGDVSAPLSALYVNKKGLFGGTVLRPIPPIQIQVLTDILRWGYDGGAQTTETLRNIGNYLYWMCGKFGLEAQHILDEGNTGGSVLPGNSTTRPYRIDFIVGAASYIVTGGDSATITDFIGYNLEFDRNGVPQSALTTEPTYFTWNRISGAFTCVPALEEFEVVALIPV